MLRHTDHQNSFELTETEVDLRLQVKPGSAIHRRSTPKTTKTVDEPVYLYENKRVDVQAWLRTVKPRLGHGKSLTHRRLPRTACVPEPRTPTHRLPREPTKSPKLHEVETERYRHNLM